MIDFLALITVIVWPVIPLFWIPVHSAFRLFRKLGLLTYLMPLITWLPLAYIIYVNKSYILAYRVSFPLVVKVLGVLFLASGGILQLWTSRLLSLSGLMGMPEISGRAKNRFVRNGAFTYVRHPTYLSHTLMFSGVFLITGVLAAGIVTFLDVLLVNVVIIPIEEKELMLRFGEEYKRYRKEVPKFFPRIGL